MAADASWVREHIRDIADYPRPGVTFRDITPLLGNPAAFGRAVDDLVSGFHDVAVDRVVGVESRGFILAAPVAYRLRAGFVPVRKAGKLPRATHAVSYSLEYGEATLEIHEDAVRAGERVLLVDDVLATGGTARATASLIHQAGAQVVGVAVLMELSFLKGREAIPDLEVRSLLVV